MGYAGPCNVLYSHYTDFAASVRFDRIKQAVAGHKHFSNLSERYETEEPTLVFTEGRAGGWWSFAVQNGMNACLGPSHSTGYSVRIESSIHSHSSYGNCRSIHYPNIAGASWIQAARPIYIQISDGKYLPHRCGIRVETALLSPYPFTGLQPKFQVDEETTCRPSRGVQPQRAIDLRGVVLTLRALSHHGLPAPYIHAHRL